MNPEGLIRFRVEQDLFPGCRDIEILELEQWRGELRRRGLVGCDAARYGGYGFGNLSRRLPEGTFLITASQTGHLDSLTTGEYVRITGWWPTRNRIRAQGLSRPSSESLTHIAAYEANPEIRCVFHVHCPELWILRDRLEIPATDPAIECGTVEMFEAVRALVAIPGNDAKGILAMAGHTDGMLAWGRTADEAGCRLLACLRRAAEIRMGNHREAIGSFDAPTDSAMARRQD